MGHFWSANFIHRDTAPDLYNCPTFDPLYGFPNGREERVMVATQQEMNDAMLPMKRRDYCAHLFIAFRACKDRNKLSRPYKCKHEKHAYDVCEFEDFVLRMKEYEREKRLLERAKRIRLRKERETLRS